MQDPCGVSHDATSGERAPDMPLLFGENAAVRSAVLRSGVSREVSAYSTQRRRSALEAARWQPCKLRGSKSAFDQIPRSLRTALQQPPRPTAIARGKLSSRVCLNSNLPARSDCLRHSRRVDLRGFLLFKAGATRMPHREKFRHRITVPILLWVTTQQSLGKHRQRAHRRRFARPPTFLKPRWS